METALFRHRFRLKKIEEQVLLCSFFCSVSRDVEWRVNFAFCVCSQRAIVGEFGLPYKAVIGAELEVIFRFRVYRKLIVLQYFRIVVYSEFK